MYLQVNLKNPPYTSSAKIPLTLGAGHQKPTLNFLWVVLWVRGVRKTHRLLIKFGKTQQYHFVLPHKFQANPTEVLSLRGIDNQRE